MLAALDLEKEEDEDRGAMRICVTTDADAARLVPGKAPVELGFEMSGEGDGGERGGEGDRGSGGHGVSPHV